MLDDLKHITITDLVDLLSSYTAIYTKHLAERKFHEEYFTSKEMVRLLQSEIERRKEIEQPPLKSGPSKKDDTSNQANA